MVPTCKSSTIHAQPPTVPYSHSHYFCRPFPHSIQSPAVMIILFQQPIPSNPWDDHFNFLRRWNVHKHFLASQQIGQWIGRHCIFILWFISCPFLYHRHTQGGVQDKKKKTHLYTILKTNSQQKKQHTRNSRYIHIHMSNQRLQLRKGPMKLSVCYFPSKAELKATHSKVVIKKDK